MNAMRDPSVLVRLHDIFSRLIMELHGYDANDINPRRVIEAYPGVAGVEYLPDVRRQGGHIVKRAGQSIVQVFRHPSHMTAGRNNSSLKHYQATWYYREQYTLAHELAHLLYWDHKNELDAIVGDEQLSDGGSSLEKLCELCASIFLMPSQCIIDECEKLCASHPVEAVGTLCKHFRVNIRTLIWRITATGACRENPWLIALFRFCHNPIKKQPAKWRLVPNSLVVPKEISRDRSYRCGDTIVYHGGGYYYVGLETLGLCPPQWQSSSSWRGLLKRYAEWQEFEAAHGDWLDPNENRVPWVDLNRPTGVRGGLRANSLGLRHDIARTNNDRLPVQNSLLASEADLFDRWRKPRPWDNKHWQLQAQTPKILGWDRVGENPYLLVACRLRMVPRASHIG